MSIFTEKEIEYLLSQRLGRLATVRADGTPQIAPVGFRYNAELEVIDIGGRYLSQSKKFRNILTTPMSLRWLVVAFHPRRPPVGGSQGIPTPKPPEETPPLGPT